MEKWPRLEEEINGVYQSMSPLKNDESKSLYRLLVDRNFGAVDKDELKDFVAYRDYSYENGKIRPIGYVERPCTGKKIQTPYMSKDGKMIGGFDLDSQTTKVYSIDKNANCSVIADLGYRTGKVDFSYDNSKIAFHVEDNYSTEDATGFIKHPTSNTSNIYVYDLESKKLDKVTSNIVGNSYYPSFLPDNTIAYIHVDPPTAKEAEPAYSIVISKVPGFSNIPSSTSVSNGFCDCEPKDKLKYLAVGQIVSFICAGNGFSGATGLGVVSIATNLTADQCKKVINDYWDKDFAESVILSIEEKKRTAEIEKLKTLTKEDLLAICPDESPHAISAKSGQVTAPKSCISCHGSTMPFIDFKKLSKTKPNYASSKRANLKDEILRRLQSDVNDPDHMPPKTFPVDPTEQNAIKKYLNSLSGQKTLNH